MKINVLVSPQNADELYFTGKTTVVIDILRATSVIVTALSNGAKEVVPVSTIEFAMKISGNAFGGKTLLGGERNTKKIDGFSLGNSPAEYTAENVEGKTIVLFTTNGTKAIVRAKFSEDLIICSYNNLSAVANHIAALDRDIEILCSATNGRFCIEDTACAGRLLKEIHALKGDVQITDAGRASVVIDDKFGKNIHKMLTESDHGKILIENGFADDLKLCAEMNNTDIIPHYVSGSVKLPVSEK